MFLRALGVLAASVLAAVSAFAERINHAGRILGPLPAVTNAVLFNTTNADAIVSAMQILPVTNPWNEDISRLPVLANSDAMIAQIISDLRADRRNLIAFQEMNFVLVPDDQPRRPIEFIYYSDESDLDGGSDPFGLYPLPANLPIEGWPSQVTDTLEQWQQSDEESDRHSIMVQPGTGFIWETWLTRLIGTNWQAANGAKFDLNSNALRPAGWTSGDAAGLPMFPALPRFDECERGVVEHACRIVVKQSRHGTYVYPATHYAAPTNNTSANLPAMGQRVRLKADFVIPANWTSQEKAILQALKKYGAMVADNGNFFSISVTPDDRWPEGCFNHFTSISITNFEVVQATGPNQGPRSPGAPVAFAGADQVIAADLAAQLQGAVNSAGSTSTNLWKFYSGPGVVTFADATLTNTTASFSAPGVYTLMLSADDGVHAVAYDAIVVTVSTRITVVISILDSSVNLNWTGGSPPFVVERALSLGSNVWSGVVTMAVQNATLPLSNSTGFFRVRGQ
ncbi:MAG: hypothetical protein H7Y43_02700 [Akkermansiaceae bacterium]|nr:hypothetical protein [Verrucomicrobiales bacterium]